MKDPLQKILRFEEQNIHGKTVIGNQIHEKWRKLLRKVNRTHDDYLSWEPYKVNSDDHMIFWARGKMAHEKIETFIKKNFEVEIQRIDYWG